MNHHVCHVFESTPLRPVHVVGNSCRGERLQRSIGLG